MNRIISCIDISYKINIKYVEKTRLTGIRPWCCLVKRDLEHKAPRAVLSFARNSLRHHITYRSSLHHHITYRKTIISYGQLLRFATCAINYLLQLTTIELSTYAI